MKTDIEITLTSANPAIQTLLSKIRIVGATVSYGVNRLPMAYVFVDPSALQSLCNFDAIRRVEVKLSVQSSWGCLNFDGIIDGLNVSQQPGSITTSIVLRHKFTLLDEIYPRILGLSAGSSNIFAVNGPYTFTNDPNVAVSGLDYLGMAFNAAIPLIGYITDKSQPWYLDTSKPIIEFIRDLCKAVVIQQASQKLLIPEGAYNSIPNSLSATIEAAGWNIQALETPVLDMINSIDIDYCDPVVNGDSNGLTGDSRLLNSSAPAIALMLINDITRMQDTLLKSFIRMVNQYNCTLVIGNTTAFVIPEAAYLKIDKSGLDTSDLNSTTPNVALAGDYTNFSFNDSGENTVKGVSVIPDPIGVTPNSVAPFLGNMSGFFTEGVTYDAMGNVINFNQVISNPAIQGNIVVKNFPSCISSFIAFGGLIGSAEVQKTIKQASNDFVSSASRGPLGLINGYIEFTQFYASQQAAKNTYSSELVGPTKTLLNNWAQLEYCRIKYNDRTGNITLPFQPTWVPGAPGTLYSKQPGTYIDFFVTDVTHSFSLSPPSTGNATTSVSFNGGRPGASTNVGLDSVAMYNYTYSNSQEFCRDFLEDVSNIQ